jgi:hypothetical protein
MSEEFPESDKEDMSLMTHPDHPWRTSDPDIHPEAFCHRCRGRNVSWFADNDLWADVMRGGDWQTEKWQWNEIICPICFIEIARDQGYLPKGEKGGWVKLAFEKYVEPVEGVLEEQGDTKI